MKPVQVDKKVETKEVVSNAHKVNYVVTADALNATKQSSFNNYDTRKMSVIMNEPPQSSLEMPSTDNVKTQAQVKATIPLAGIK